MEFLARTTWGGASAIMRSLYSEPTVFQHGVFFGGKRLQTLHARRYSASLPGVLQFVRLLGVPDS